MRKFTGVIIVILYISFIFINTVFARGILDGLVGVSAEVSSRASAEGSSKLTTHTGRTTSSINLNAHFRASNSNIGGSSAATNSSASPQGNSQSVVARNRESGNKKYGPEEHQVQRKFIDSAKELIYQESAIGYGDHLKILASLYHCKRGDIVRFQRLVHAEHKFIFRKLSIPTQDIHNNLDAVIEVDSNKIPSCQVFFVTQ